MNNKGILYLLAGIVLFAAIIMGASTLYGGLTGNIKSESEKQLTEELAQKKAESDKADSANSEAENNSENEANITPAPNFTVYSTDGTAVSFSEKKGKPVIINFWATWCGPCKNEMPHFEKAYREYSDRIEFMMINPTDGMNDTKESVENFIADTEYTFPVYLDFDSDASAKYGINSFPNTFFIDRNGNLLGYYPGMMSEDTLYSCIDILLGKSQ